MRSSPCAGEDRRHPPDSLWLQPQPRARSGRGQLRPCALPGTLAGLLHIGRCRASPPGSGNVTAPPDLRPPFCESPRVTLRHRPGEAAAAPRPAAGCRVIWGGIPGCGGRSGPAPRFPPPSALIRALGFCPGSFPADESAGGEAGGVCVGSPRTPAGRAAGGQGVGRCCCPDPRGGQQRRIKGRRMAEGGERRKGGTGPCRVPGRSSSERSQRGRGGELEGSGAAGPAPSRVLHGRLPGEARPAAPGVLLTPPWQSPSVFHNRATRSAIQGLRHPPREGRELSPGVWLSLCLNRHSEVRDLLRGNLRDFLGEQDAKVGLTLLTLAAQEDLFAAFSKDVLRFS